MLHILIQIYVIWFQKLFSRARDGCLFILHAWGLILVIFCNLRYPHVAKDHLVKLLKQLMLSTAHPLNGKVNSPNAADVPTLLGDGSFSLLDGM